MDSSRIDNLLIDLHKIEKLLMEMTEAEIYPASLLNQVFTLNLGFLEKLHALEEAQCMDIVEKLCPVELKPAVLRTLSVIALKEPIRQSALKDMRGSNAYEHVQELLEKGLISRTKDKNGRSFNLKTTPKFAEYFKLKGDTKALAKMLDLEKRIEDEPEN